MFVLLQVFGTVWHQAAHAAEHSGSLSGIELASEDRGEEAHRHLASQTNPDGTGHLLHHALHCSSHLLEHVQLFAAQPAMRILEAAQPARWRTETALEGSTVALLLPPPNA